MKGDYVKEEKQDHHHSSNMFAAKLHQTQKYHPPPPQSHHHHHHHHQQTPTSQPQPQSFLHHSFQVSPTTTTTSEEADSRNSPAHQDNTATPTAATPSTNAQQQPPPSSHDGATIEVVRRPRGRPPGSKNKPKPPVIITRESEPSMSPYILELPSGVDIVDTLVRYCRKRNMGICILNGSGTVSNITLRQPSTAAPPGATVTFHGRFDILSISATLILSPNPTSASTSPPNNGVSIVNGFAISLAGPQGQVVGGAVVGSLVTASTVYLIAATFNNPSYHRLPAEEEVAKGRQQSPPTAVSGGGGDSSSGGHPPQPPSTAGEMSMYSCHLPSDVIWAPTARQPPPPPY